MNRRWTALLAALLAGCVARAKTGAAGDDLGAGGGHASALIRNGGSIADASRPDPHSARRSIPVVISLDVYHLTVPAGAVSNNDDFWKRVDEQRVDVATYDLLLKNGVRVGVGHDADWGWFKGLLGKYPAARSARGRTPPGKEGYVELEMHTHVPWQTIFWLDDHDNGIGRTFEKCDDLLGISFIASTHHPGEAVVKVCPIVRGLRRYFHVTILNNEQTDIELAYPEHLYDLRLETMVPLNDFLIVAPSKQAKLPSSIGSTFLISEGKTEPIEHVLVIVPRVYRTDDPADSKDL